MCLLKMDALYIRFTNEIKTQNTIIMKKLFAIIALVAFIGFSAGAQTEAVPAATTKAKTEKVVKKEAKTEVAKTDATKADCTKDGKECCKNGATGTTGCTKDGAHAEGKACTGTGAEGKACCKDGSKDGKACCTKDGSKTEEKKTEEPKK
jgi:hypothetical protein